MKTKIESSIMTTCNECAKFEKYKENLQNQEDLNHLKGFQELECHQKRLLRIIMP